MFYVGKAYFKSGTQPQNIIDRLEELRTFPLEDIGLKLNKKSKRPVVVEQAFCHNMTIAQFEYEINRLAYYIFDGTRAIKWDNKKSVPIIYHEGFIFVNKERVLWFSDSKSCATLKNQTYSDISFAKFIYKFVRKNNDTYSFFNTHFLVMNTSKILP